MQLMGSLRLLSKNDSENIFSKHTPVNTRKIRNKCWKVLVLGLWTGGGQDREKNICF